jgi:bacillithiol disulfide reductase
MSVRDVLIVGVGPSGLATAIAAKQHGLDYVLVEKAVLVNSIFNFPMHTVFFTTPELLEIGGLPLVTPYDKPTRLEALDHEPRRHGDTEIRSNVVQVFAAWRLRWFFVRESCSMLKSAPGVTSYDMSRSLC